MSTISDRAFYTIIGITLLVILGSVAFVILGFPIINLESLSRQQGTPTPTTQCQTFPQTGKEVCGIFLTYWTEHGGVTWQGYPISNEFTEISEINGKPYTVQYFERSVLEYHPENQPPYNVLLSLLGTIQYKKLYPNGTTDLKTFPKEMKPEGAALFPQTGKVVRGIFLDYWLTNGGPLQYGYPISNAFTEHSQPDGQARIVQYFERAVFEYHPEQPAPYNVQVTLLGTFQFERKYPSGIPGGASPTRTPAPGGRPTITRLTATPTRP